MLWASGTDSFSYTDFAAHLPATDDLIVPNIKKTHSFTGIEFVVYTEQIVIRANILVMWYRLAMNPM